MQVRSAFYKFSIIFSVCTVCVFSDYTTAGYGERYDGESESESDSSTQVLAVNSTDSDNTDNVGTSEVMLKMATQCETPNGDPGFCIEIRKCIILLRQLNNTDARPFLRESTCGPRNEDRLNPKVCCGKYDNFRNVSKNIDQMLSDEKVFPKSCGVQKPVVKSRIVGGKEASLGEYPWMARLIHKNKNGYKTFGCSGFLIHVKYVITAAHCTHPNITRIRGSVYSVVLGEHNTETRVDCSTGGIYCAEERQISRAETVITHPDYNPNSAAHYNDISIIHLKKGARLSNYVQPICLLKDASQVPSRYYLSGWGKTENEASSKIKMKVEISTFDQVECREKYSLLNIELRNSQICAGGEELKDSCTGDSGGPLMMPTSNGTWYASGIVSYGIGCGMKGWPGVYTNIASYVPWIKRQIIKLGMVSTRSNFRNKGHKRHKKNKTTTPIPN